MSTYVNFKKVGNYRVNATTMYEYCLILLDTNSVEVSKWLKENPAYKLIDVHRGKFAVSDEEPIIAGEA